MAFVWRTGRAMAPQPRDVRAVLFDRDDSLVRGTPRDNGDPEQVQPLPGLPRPSDACGPRGSP